MLVNTINVAAATAPPLETPINPGSARGLRKSPCITAPDTAKPPPTSKPSNTLGRRIATITASCVALNSKFKLWCNKFLQIMATICVGVIFTAPMLKQSRIILPRTTVRVINRRVFSVGVKRVINFRKYW